MQNLFPPVTTRLLLFNIGLYIVTVMLQSQLDLVEILGLHWPGSPLFRPWQVVTHIFMHGSEMHLFSNMLALWMFGAALENNLWGGKRFFIYFLVTGLGAAGLHLAVTGSTVLQTESAYEQYVKQPGYESFQRYLHQVPTTGRLQYNTAEGPANTHYLMEAWAADPDNPEYLHLAAEMTEYTWRQVRDEATVGASGAVFGILLAFGMFFPETYVFVGFLLPLKAKYFVALYGFWELYRGVQHNPLDNVAHFAHLGGMLFGYLLIRYWQRNRKRTL